MANWKIILEDAKTAFFTLILIILVIAVSGIWIGFIILIIPVVFIAGWMGAKKK